MTDPIADMLTRIRNILRVRKTIVRIPFSNIKYQIAKILKKRGFYRERRAAGSRSAAFYRTRSL